MQLIECVPNFSEGRNTEVIGRIADAICLVEGAYLLHKDSGFGVNRTVMTIAGSPEAVMEAAFRAIEQASQLIDMREHSGHHPCIGATDVCPIIPLQNISMAECILLSKKLADRIWQELKIPVYLYAESATIPERKKLAYLRKGGYSSLANRAAELIHQPDFGFLAANPKSGATILGARSLLIAYNINLNTQDIKIAKDIAHIIRTQRQSPQHDVTSIGAFNWQDTTAIGWYVEEYKCCQISMNLMNYKSAGLYQAFVGVSELALQHGTSVKGSEIIGMVPLHALLDTGKLVLKEMNPNDQPIATEDDLLNAAIKFLNLGQFYPFKVLEKVLEYKLAPFIDRN